MLIAEVFGYGVDNQTDEAWSSRLTKNCPFRGTSCTKSSKSDPIGVCSLTDGASATSLCPVRFIENDSIFKDAAREAFGEGATFGIFPEVRILKIENEDILSRDRKIGKVDYVLGKIEGGSVVDFAALEVQAVYFSGGEIRTPLRHFISTRSLDIENSDRRPDFRSSAQKRLVPQLQLKVPVFRRWGKKFFVVVDAKFFDALPQFSGTSAANSELTWLIYPFKKSGLNFSLGDPTVLHSEWDEVRNALREGVPPDPREIILELQGKLDRKRNAAKILET